MHRISFALCSDELWVGYKTQIALKPNISRNSIFSWYARATAAHNKAGGRNRQPWPWKMKSLRPTWGLITSGMVTNLVIASCRLPPEWPADLGFKPLTFLGWQTLDSLDHCRSLHRYFFSLWNRNATHVEQEDKLSWLLLNLLSNLGESCERHLSYESITTRTG